MECCAIKLPLTLTRSFASREAAQCDASLSVPPGFLLPNINSPPTSDKALSLPATGPRGAARSSEASPDWGTVRTTWSLSREIWFSSMSSSSSYPAGPIFGQAQMHRVLSKCVMKTYSSQLPESSAPLEVFCGQLICWNIWQIHLSPSLSKRLGFLLHQKPEEPASNPWEGPCQRNKVHYFGYLTTPAGLPSRPCTESSRWTG